MQWCIRVGTMSQNVSGPVTSEQIGGEFVTQQVTCVRFSLSEIPPTERTRRAELSLHVEFDGDDDAAGGNRTSTTLATVYRATRPLPGNVCRVDDAQVRAGHLRLVGQRTVVVSGQRNPGDRWTNVTRYARSRAVGDRSTLVQTTTNPKFFFGRRRHWATARLTSTFVHLSPGFRWPDTTTVLCPTSRRCPART